MNGFAVRRFSVAAVLAAIAGLFTAAIAEEPIDLGPAVGSEIPHDLAAPDATGAQRSFEDLVGQNGMALFFVRSVDWCPYCKAQTMSVDSAIAEFEARGLSVVFVSYDGADKQAAFVEQNDIDATLLSDGGSQIIDAFGLRNEQHKEGRFAGIPHPAVFLISDEKKIMAKLYEKDFVTDDKSYRRRPAVDAVLAAADQALAR